MPKPYDIFNKMKGKIVDKGAIHRVIAGGLDEAVQRNFRTQSAGLGGEPWAPLAKSTLRNKRRKNRKILQLRGQAGGLLGSITTAWDETYAEIGTYLVYAAIHQYGGVIEHGARTETFKRKRWGKDKFNKKGNLVAKKGQFQKGTSPGKGFTFKSHSITIPARPYLTLTDRNHRQIVSEIAFYIGE